MKRPDFPNDTSSTWAILYRLLLFYLKIFVITSGLAAIVFFFYAGIKTNRIPMNALLGILSASLVLILCYYVLKAPRFALLVGKEEGLGGMTRYLAFIVWLVWKRLQLFARSHLFHVLGILLGVLAIVRAAIFSNTFSVDRIGLVEISMLVIGMGTLAAAIWELSGNTRNTSAQELRFATAITYISEALQELAYVLDRESDPSERINRFIQDFLEVTSGTLRGKKLVVAALMVRSANEDFLHLIAASRSSHYPENLQLPYGHGKMEVGPDAYSYSLNRVVYKPIRGWRYCFPINSIDRKRYDLAEPLVARTVPSLEGEYQSVLSVPVGLSFGPEQKHLYGVLNFSTNSFDPFAARDFLMAESFGHLLGLALHLISATVNSKEDVKSSA